MIGYRIVAAGNGHGGRRSKFWSEERDDRLRALLALGWSSSLIGDELGCSRNAVIGRRTRLGLSAAGYVRVRNPRSTSPRLSPRANGGAVLASLKATQRRKERDVAGSNTRIRNTLIARARARGDLEALEAVGLPSEPGAPAKPIPLMELRDHHCRWPLEGGSCGKHKVRGRPYCTRHARIAYVQL